MNILFIHPNFPGQFKHLAKLFGGDPKHKVVFACRYPNKQDIPGVRKIVATPRDFEKKKTTHNYLQEFEIATYKAQSMWRLLLSLKQEGFIPDLIYAHPGWGDGMLIKEVFPDSKYVAYMEFYYRTKNSDIDFANKEPHPNTTAKTRIRNATNLINMEAADWLISPTHWQASLHPHEFHSKLSVIHEGIDTNKIDRNKVGDDYVRSLNLPQSAKLVTYISRNFEPYRGFESAMRAIDIIAKKQKNVHFLMVGADGVSYSAKPKKGEKTYRQQMLSELNIDKSRIHWLGNLDYGKYLQVLKASNAHIYLTYPFVLSWSFLESMAMETPLIASNTAPVLEVAKDNENAMLVDFFDYEEIADKTIELLATEEKQRVLGKNARELIVKTYSLDRVLPEYVKLLENIASFSSKNYE